ncbi:MAG: hypothetical protein CMH84_19240 [Nocardioides sp.]|nr:hypothetical protein [Nocardioides sp.]
MTIAPARAWVRVPTIGGVQARHATKLVLGAAMLLGLLLMHGFGGHAAHASAPATHAPHSATLADTSDLDRTRLVATADHLCSERCADVSAAPAPGQPTPGGGLVALCATVLLALTALLLLGTAGQWRPALLQPLRATGTGPPSRSRLAVPAPHLHALSILRC